MPKQIASQIEETAKSLDIFHRVQEMVSLIVTNGIREAEVKIQQELEKAAQEQGIVRSLPLVGGLVNWWSPVKSEPQGKRFNLTAVNVVDSPSKSVPFRRESIDRIPKLDLNQSSSDDSGEESESE